MSCFLLPSPSNKLRSSGPFLGTGRFGRADFLSGLFRGIAVLHAHRLAVGVFPHWSTAETAKPISALGAALSSIFPLMLRAASHRAATLALFRDFGTTQDAIGLHRCLTISALARLVRLMSASSISCVILHDWPLAWSVIPSGHERNLPNPVWKRGLACRSCTRKACLRRLAGPRSLQRSTKSLRLCACLAASVLAFSSPCLLLHAQSRKKPRQSPGQRTANLSDRLSRVDRGQNLVEI